MEPFADLEQENADLRDQLEVLSRPAFADPETQLRHDIWLRWLHQIPEEERATRALRTYTVGPDFMDSLSLDKVTRTRLLAVVVDVLTADVFSHPSRQPHQQQATKGNGSRPLVRSDGATAWRCHLKSGTPSAPRLLWWEKRDGSVELGRTAVHDDLRLR